MPLMRTLKIFCRDCGWHVVVNRGDVIATFDDQCPSCHSRDVRQVPASSVDRLDLLAQARGAAYDLRSLVSRGK